MKLMFVMPVHRRQLLTAVCLRQLRRTCDTLSLHGIHASAVVVGDDANLHTAEQLGFATVRRDNMQLGRKWNDGIQLACDPHFNPDPADYVVPIGSDNWIDPALLTALPAPDTILGFRHVSAVRDDGREITPLRIPYFAGSGVRVIPAPLLTKTGFRPCDEDAQHSCDYRAVMGITKANGAKPKVVFGDRHPNQIVGWKHPEHLHSYRELTGFKAGPVSTDPFGVLAAHYPADALGEMELVYQ